MTCREKLITEHPEWSEVIVMKCTDIFTPNEYFALDGQDLFWIDIYPGAVEECSEAEYDAEQIGEYEARIEELQGTIELQRARLEILDNKIKLRDEDIDKLVKENEKLRKSVDILSDGIDRRENENTELYNKVSVLDRTIEEMQEKINLRDEEIEKLVKENEELRITVAEREKDVAILTKRDVAAHEVIIKKNEEIDKLVKENEELRKKLDASDAAEYFNDHVDELRNITKENEYVWYCKDALMKELVERNKTIDNLKAHVADLDDKLRDAEYDKYKLGRRIGNLESERMDIVDSYNELKYNIEKMGFTVNEDNEVITPLHKPHVKAPVEYFNEEIGKVIPIAERPYAKYANHIYMKYKALTDSGFSHDDAMALIPMWDDNEFEGFKHIGLTSAVGSIDEMHEYKED